jgi:hypothetical protein
VLYQMAHADWSSEYPIAAQRAQKALNKADVRAKASPALNVALDLRVANTCEGKKAVFPRAKEIGDNRTLVVLRTYQPTRGCGFLSSRDCWPCMHKDGSLKQTIQSLEDRLPSAPRR